MLGIYDSITVPHAFIHLNFRHKEQNQTRYYNESNDTWCGFLINTLEYEYSGYLPQPENKVHTHQAFEHQSSMRSNPHQ